MRKPDPTEERTLFAGLEYLERFFRVRDVGTEILVKGPKVRLEFDAIGRLPTGQYVLVEAKRAIPEHSAWNLALQMLTRKRQFAEVSDIPEHQVATVVIAGLISERTAKTLAGNGIASVATSPEPRVVDKGQLISTIDAHDFRISRLLDGSWVVVGGAGSGKTYFLKELVAQAKTQSTRMVVLGRQTEYQFESVPPSLLDSRLTSLASNNEVPVEQFRDALSPAQLELLKTLIGSGMLSYERLRGEFSERLMRSKEFPSETNKKVLKFRDDLVGDIGRLRDLLDNRSRVIGIDTEGLTRDQGRMMLLATFQLLSSIVAVAKTRVVVVIDDLELFITDGDPQDVALQWLDRIARAGRHLGISIVLASQRVAPALQAVQAEVQGCIVFRLVDRDSALEIARFWQIEPEIFVDMTRRLSRGSFVALTREGVYV